MKSAISIIVFSCLFFFYGKSQITYNMPLDSNTGKIIYKEVVVENAPKDTLFVRSFLWVKNYFPNFSSVVTTKDQENGLLVCNVRVKLTTTDKKGKTVGGGVIIYSLRIEIKDNKYRIIATDFKRADVMFPVEQWFKDENVDAVAIHQQHFMQLDAEVKKTIESVKVGMKEKIIIKDEW